MSVSYYTELGANTHQSIWIHKQNERSFSVLEKSEGSEEPEIS